MIEKQQEQGVTLIELMIVLVIAAILVGGVYTLFNTQQRSYSVQDQVTGVQQDARAALSILARDVRMAGLLIGSGSEGFNINGAQFAITPNNPGGTDSITLAYGADEFTSGGTPVTVTAVSGTEVTLSEDPSSFFDTASDDKFVAFEGDIAVYEISSIDSGNKKLTLTSSPPVYIANVGARVFRAKSIMYRVQNGELQRAENTDAPQPMIGDATTTIVEDLQFAYQISGDTNWYNDASEFPSANSEADIRMVRINLIVRTAVPDPEETSFFKPASEDNPQSNTDTGCRRRVYTTVVKARNL